MPKAHGEVNFVRRIQAGENGVGGFDEAAHPFRVARQLRDGQRVADGGDVGVVHRLVGLGLDGDADLPVVGQHLVQRLDQQLDAAPAVLGFAQVGAFARQPEDDQVRVEITGDVNASQRAVDGVLPALRVVARVGAVNGLRAEPKPRGDHLGRHAGVVELLLELLCFLAQLRVGLAVNVRHRVVVMKHHGVEAKLLELVELPVEGLHGAGGRAVRVLTFADIPGTETELVLMLFCHKRAPQSNGAAGKSKPKIACEAATGVL